MAAVGVKLDEKIDSRDTPIKEINRRKSALLSAQHERRTTTESKAPMQCW